MKFINDIKKSKILFDYVYETTGITNIIEDAYNFINNKGKLILIGVPRFNDKIKINTLGINYGKKIIGSYGGGVVPNKDISKIFSYIKKNKVKLDNLVQGSYSFKNINKVLKSLIKGKIINKPVIKF